MNGLVKYAGFDPEDQPKPKKSRRVPVPYAVRRLNQMKKAVFFFNAGMDTMQIAKAMNIREPRALRLISIERAARNGYPSPYEART